MNLINDTGNSEKNKKYQTMTGIDYAVGSIFFKLKIILSFK